jgi:N-acetylglucosaminyldiphosphoundecaprenol N-acetyl-beta-D-mannosaminyltransferase
VMIDPLTYDELNMRIANIIKANEKRLILNVNVYCLNLAYKLNWLRDYLNRGEIVFCDGVGVILGAKIVGEFLPERITYAEWAWQLGGFCESEGLSLFLLGSKPGVTERATLKLKERYPRLQIVGNHHGYFNKLIDSEENRQIVEMINKVKPNILIVGFGMPLQEQWLLENWNEIDANIALTGGAVFDYLSGELRRAPKWMTDNGLEWLGRMLIEPRRLWKRYLLGNPLFLWRVLLQRFGVLRYD